MDALGTQMSPLDDEQRQQHEINQKANQARGARPSADGHVVPPEIPLYLITGYLGAGKSTFLKRLLEEETRSGKRVGVVVNEIGAVSIDAALLGEDGGVETYEVNNGSIFCVCKQADFTTTLAGLMNSALDVVFIEASGISDPFGMADFLQNLEESMGMADTKAPRRFAYQGSVCIVDATTLEDCIDVVVAVGNAISKSSLVVINKADIATEEQLKEARRTVVELSPGAKIVTTSFGVVPLDTIMENVTPGLSQHGSTSNKCYLKPKSYTLDMPERYRADDVRAFMEGMESAVRQKGFFEDETGELLLAESVRGSVTLTPYRVGRSGEPKTRLVLIGEDTSDFWDEVVETWKRCLGNRQLICEEE